jgi:hypothetical protein
MEQQPIKPQEPVNVHKVDKKALEEAKKAKETAVKEQQIITK